MARRRKTSDFDGLIHIASRLPWWLCLLVAFFSWLWRHSYAISPPPIATADHKQLGQLLAGTALGSFSMILQYLLLAAFVLGAIDSVIARATRPKLIVDVASATKLGKVIEGIAGCNLSSSPCVSAHNNI